VIHSAIATEDRKPKRGVAALCAATPLFGFNGYRTSDKVNIIKICKDSAANIQRFSGMKIVMKPQK
jgi:hypothetical protein